MTNCIIVHGCADEEEQYLPPEEQHFDKQRMPRLEKQLTHIWIKTERPSMPNSRAPDYDAYKEVFEKLHVDENTILIGHSCGAAFLVRRLWESRKHVSQLILVAPWKIPDGDDVTKKLFYEYPIDEGIKNRVDHITIFSADNEEDEGKESAQIFYKALSGNYIELVGKWHYTLEEMWTEEFPEIVEVIKNHVEKLP
jgi:predicted alpha/beta hydrolase family esterase